MKKLLLLGTTASFLGVVESACAANFFKNPGQWFSDTGGAINQGAIHLSKETEKTVAAGSHAIEDAAHRTGHFIEKHPWEVIGAATFLVGGYYLVGYEGYALTLKMGDAAIPLVHGGAAAGTASMGLGGGVLGYAFMQPVGVQPDSVTGAAMPKPHEPGQTSALPPANIGATPGPRLDLTPRVGNTPSGARLSYAVEVERWVEHEKLVERFDPADYMNQLSPGEQRILDALNELSAVSNSSSEELALAQQKERGDLPRKIYMDALKDIATSASVPDDAMKTILQAVLESTVTADGFRVERVQRTRELTQLLGGFLDKRFNLQRISPVPAKMPPSGPAIEGKPLMWRPIGPPPPVHLF